MTLAPHQQPVPTCIEDIDKLVLRRCPPLELEVVLKVFGPTIKRLAFKYLPNESTAKIDREDLEQIACTVLWDCLSKFDPAHGVLFSKYVTQRMAYGMLTALRSNRHLPRSLNQDREKTNEAEGRLSMELGRRPSDQELAEYLGNPPDWVAKIRSLKKPGEFSFDRVIDATSRGNRCDQDCRTVVFGDPAESPDIKVIEHDYLDHLATLAQLEKFSLHVLKMVLFDKMTLPLILAELNRDNWTLPTGERIEQLNRGQLERIVRKARHKIIEMIILRGEAQFKDDDVYKPRE